MLQLQFPHSNSQTHLLREQGFQVHCHGQAERGDIDVSRLPV